MNQSNSTIKLVFIWHLQHHFETKQLNISNRWIHWFFMASLFINFRLRPCVLVTVSEFSIISWNYTDFCENKKPNSLVQFSVSVTVPTGVPFRKFWDFFEYFESPEPLSVHISYVRHTQKMVKNTKSCFSWPLSVLGRFWMRFWNVCIL